MSNLQQTKASRPKIPDDLLANINLFLKNIFILIKLGYCFNIDYSCGPEAFKAIAASFTQYCSKFSIYFAANFLAFLSQSATEG